MSEMCAALKATRQGYYAWKSRPSSAHALRDEELAVAVSQVRDEVRGIYGAPKTFMRPRALGVRTSRKRVARIMRERGRRGVTHACAYATREEAALDLFEYDEVVYNRARIHSVLGCLSPAEFEEANWPKENSRSKAA